MDLRGKKISVIGLARSGLSAANFLAARGARVFVSDRQPRESLAGRLAELDPTVQTRFGDSRPETGSALVILSPGVDIESPDLEESRKRGVEIISEIELATRFNQTPIIAVTGTNGKTTTTTLIAEILRAAGKTVGLGGNIGVPFISLIDGAERDFMVIEVSSFQLEAVRDFRPAIALVLNLTADHLNRHKTMHRYAELKRNIAVQQTPSDSLVLNQDDPAVRDMGNGLAAQKFYFSLRGRVERGGWMEQGRLYLRCQDETQILCSVADLNQVMQWQPENVLAAAIAAAIAGVDTPTIAKTVRGFRGLEHRLEWVRNVGGVDFVNDSKSTNVGSLLKCLDSFSRPVILIAGGQDKGMDFSPLRTPLKKLKRLVLIGEAKNKFRAIVNGDLPCEEADSLETAVRNAFHSAQAGDTVLLSPGCASFDMFANYEDRGRQFKQIVHRL